MKLRMMLAGFCALAALGAVAGSASAAYPGEWHMNAVSQPDHRTVSFELGALPGNPPIICQGSEVAGKGPTVASMSFTGCKSGSVSTVVTVATPFGMSVTNPVSGMTRVAFNNLKIKIAIGGLCPMEFIGSAYGEGPGNPTTSESFTAATSKLTYYRTVYGSCSSLGALPNQPNSFVANYASDPI